MDTPHIVFRKTLDETRDPIASIRMIREQFGMSLSEEKEIWIQVVTGTAISLEQYQANLILPLDQVLRDEDL